MARVRLLVVALVCAFAALAASAQAAPSWLSSFPISAPGTDNGPIRVAMDPNGDAAAIWRETHSPDHIVASMRPAGGSFGALQTLDTNGDTPRIGMDANGDAVAVWFDGAADHVQFSRAAAGAPFASGQDIPGQTTSATPPDLALAVAPSGEAVSAWRNGSTVSVSIAPPGAGFGSPQTFSESNPSDPQLAITPSGEAVLVFIQTGTDALLKASVRPPGGVFGSPATVSTVGEDAQSPSVALDATGDGVIAWASLVSVSHFKPEAVFLTPGGFSSVKDIDSAQTQSLGDVAASIDPAGLVRALWTPSDGSTESLLAATAPVGGSFSTPPQTLSTTVQSGPDLASDPAGDTIAVWQDFDGTFLRVGSAVAPAGQAFGSSKLISPEGQHSDNGPFVAMDAQGDGIVAWPLRDPMSGNDAVQIAGYDAAGPQLRGLSIPSSGVVNRPLNFSVAPVDVWSQVTSTQWTFGDGQTSGSATPMHLFGAAGKFDVSLTATDALGNATSAAGVVTVAPAPPRKKPRISRASLSRRRFRAAHGRGASIAAPVGTRVRFTLSQVASVRFHVERCAKVRHGKCRRYKLMRGSVSKGGGAGRDSVRFTGRWRKKPLRPGLYRLDLQASTRGVKSATTRLAFQIVRR